RPSDEVALQQVVGDRRLYFHASEQRIDRGRHDLARAERRSTDEHDLPLQGVGRCAAGQHICCGYVGERVFLAPVAQQQVALAVEGYLLIADFKRRGVDVYDAQRDVAWLVGGHHRSERQTGVEASVERGDE